MSAEALLHSLQNGQCQTLMQSHSEFALRLHLQVTAHGSQAMTAMCDHSQAMFLIITYGSLAAAAALFAGIIYFASSRNLLLIPDKSKDE